MLQRTVYCDKLRNIILICNEIYVKAIEVNQIVEHGSGNYGTSLKVWHIILYLFGICFRGAEILGKTLPKCGHWRCRNKFKLPYLIIRQEQDQR